MKVLKESLLLNDLESVLDLNEEVLIMRNGKEPMVILPLIKYNELKEELYKKNKNG